MTRSSAKTTATNEQIEKLAELARAEAKRVLGKLPLLGPVVWLMMQQGPARHAFLSDLEWRILPPLVLDQYKLYMKDGAPLAFASWARLSAEAAARFRAPLHRLAPADWRSGEQVWIVDVVAPFGNAWEVLQDLRRTALAGQSIRQLAPELPAGDVRVIEWPAAAMPASA